MPELLNNVVQVTTDYNQFKFLIANRDVNGGHVKALVESIKEKGNLTPADPILVNDRYEVIDGQHRITALKELGLPVHYTMVDGAGIDVARQMNLLHRKWSSPDYLKTYAAENRKAYVDFNTLMEQYPELSYSTILVVVNNRVDVSGVHAKFRKGELPEFDLDEVQRKLDYLMELVAIDPVFKTKSLANAVVKATRITGFDARRLLDRVRLQVSELRPYQNIDDNLLQLEKVYNYKYSLKNRLRFY